MRTLAIICTAIVLSASSGVLAETAGEKAAREEMAKAQAQKARNDAEVERQRKAKQQEIDNANRLQEACKRARTC
jgi:hypothetical protein